MRTTFALALAACASSLIAADNGNRNFNVTFSNCREYVGFGPMSLVKAQAALPAGFTATNTQGSGGFVIRTSACELVGVDGSRPKPALVAHIGINIVSPDGTGDISNYTLLYATNSDELADHLRKSGLPAVYNRELVAEDPAVRPGEVYISIFGESLTPYSITGQVADPAMPPFPFLANWWYSGKAGRIRMSTDIPAIAFGPAGLVFHTSSSSFVGTLIGGNRDADFPWYNVRGVFGSARMTVTTNR